MFLSVLMLIVTAIFIDWLLHPKLFSIKHLTVVNFLCKASLLHFQNDTKCTKTEKNLSVTNIAIILYVIVFTFRLSMLKIIPCMSIKNLHDFFKLKLFQMKLSDNINRKQWVVYFFFDVQTVYKKIIKIFEKIVGFRHLMSVFGRGNMFSTSIICRISTLKRTT